MENVYIPHLSVDCVLFGFDEKQLKVLVVKRDRVPGENPDLHSGLFKLPGRLIYEDEFLEDAASKLIKELTSSDDIHMQQFQVFGNPNRIQSPNDLLWLQTQTRLPIRRVVTIAFYALIKIEEDLTDMLERHNARWINLPEVKGLAFDHDEILQEAYAHLKKELTTSPLEFNLLPEYFTLNSLQSLYEVILDQHFDNRNFRKKILKMSYLVETDKTEQKVTHRPAKLYRFDADKYAQNQREMSLFFL
ncbi:MAG: DNA mismatch repair protein MutT [Paludibacteraceae bacterium]|nr:DNA mismatch repair protein MutT [Paludibacteraceae bacterium]